MQRRTFVLGLLALPFVPIKPKPRARTAPNPNYHTTMNGQTMRTKTA